MDWEERVNAVVDYVEQRIESEEPIISPQELIKWITQLLKGTLSRSLV